MSIQLKPSMILLNFESFRESRKWWDDKTEAQQKRLIKKHDLVTYADLLAFYLEQKK